MYLVYWFKFTPGYVWQQVFVINIDIKMKLKSEILKFIHDKVLDYYSILSKKELFSYFSKIVKYCAKLMTSIQTTKILVFDLS